MTDDKLSPRGTRRRRRRRRPEGDSAQSNSTTPTATPNAPPTDVGTDASTSKADDTGAPAKRRRRRRKPDGEPSNEPRSEQGKRERAPRSRAPKAGRAQQRGPKEPRQTETRQAETETGQAETETEQTGPRPRPTGPKLEHRTNLAPDTSSEESEAPIPSQERWGDDSDAPTPEVKLSQDLPANPASNDLDPTTAGLGLGYEGQLSARVCNVIGVRFVAAGKAYLFDGGDGTYRKGDRVIVEADHGRRAGMVVTTSLRRPPPRTLKKIVRRESEADRLAETEAQAGVSGYLAIAKEAAKELRLPIKVFRVVSEQDGNGLSVYYSCDEKTDVRRLTSALSDKLPMRVHLRHSGVRDEAKSLGGIGTCGLELCCSTWLPAFVPVSIKNAKDQGLVLNPTKVSGLCGRLKCCLVYEQETYAAMRKGLPKLGKRVITDDGFEGRVVEVDVLHQRIRVAIGRGESKMYGKGEVKAMFASQPQGGSGKSAKRSKSKPRKSHKDSPADAEPTTVSEASASEASASEPAVSAATEDKLDQHKRKEEESSNE